MKGKRTDIIIIYLICVITKVVISLRVYPVLYLSDEVSALSATALVAGFDWSAVVSHAGYYGFGFLALLAPLFNIVRSPVWIYRIIVTVSCMMEALCSVVCYHTIPYLIPDLERGKKNTIVLLSSLTTIAATLTMGNRNEDMACLLVWITIYLLVRFLLETGRKKAMLELLLLFVIAYSFTIHARLLMIPICLCFVSVIYMLVHRKLPFHILFYMGLAVCFIVMQRLTDAYRGLIWKESGVVRNASATGQVGEIIPFIRENGFTWPIVRYAIINVIGQIYTGVQFTGGLFAVALIATLVSWFPPGIRIKNPDIMFICELFILLCMTGQIIGTTVSWMPGYFYGDDHSTKAITYLRYFGIYLSPLVMFGLVRMEEKPQIEKTVLLISLIITIVLTAIWFWKIWPVVNSGGRQGQIYFGFIGGAKSDEKATELHHLQAGLVALEITMLIVALCMKSKKQECYIFLILYFVAMRIYSGDRTIINEQKNYAQADAGYQAIEKLKEKMPIEEIYVIETRNITDHQVWYLYQFLNYDVHIITELPDKIEKGICFSNGLLAFEGINYGIVRLDDNEYAYCFDKQMISAMRNAGYNVEDSVSIIPLENF